MSRLAAVSHEFVEFIPEQLEEGIIYISIPYATACHKCCCGCGSLVVTPLTPTDWTLIFDGETISLDNSIGNWSFPCRSHYWILRNRVRWSNQWSKEQIEAGRRYDALNKQRHFGDAADTSPALPSTAQDAAARQTVWDWFKSLWS